MIRKIYAQGWWVLAGLLFSGAVMTGFFLAKEFEHAFMPVVTDVTVTRSVVTPEAIFIWGTFTKDRECKFMDRIATSRGVILDLEFLDAGKNKSSNRSVGPQVFGPWRISPPMLPLSITTRHQCHQFWQTSTKNLVDYQP
ncbi:MAG: hypothetical protein H7293_20020 [Candidatus Saccharibacteria bacterium]|nr:hypothetical protein [Rhodoferax sp.]